MTDEKSPQPEDASPKGTSSNPIDFPAIFNAAKEIVTKPKEALETIRSIAKDPGGYFSSGKDGSINDSLGFFLVTTAVALVFAWLGAIFSFQILAIVFAIPVGLFWALVKLVIATAIVFVVATMLAKGKGTFWDAASVVCRLSWIFLIPAIPFFVWFPGILNALILIAAYLLWAYLAIPSIATKFAISDGKHAIPIWGVAGVLSILILIGAFTGAAVNKGIEFTNEYADQKIEDIQREAAAQIAAMEQQVQAAQDSGNFNEAQAQALAVAQETAAAQAEAARRTEEQKQSVIAEAKAAGQDSPAKQVKDILSQLRAVGATDAPSNLKGALRKLNGHLANADFSGIKAKGLDLRSVDLSGAKFDNAVIDNWWFHGFQNLPGSKLDGASFKGATFTKTNMKKTSLIKADFSGAKLVSTKDFEVAISLDEANVSGADFSNITFTGPPRGKALRLSKVDARGADFTKSQLPNTDFQGSDIRGADFSDSVLRGVVLKRVDMRDTKFRNTDLTEMQIPRHVKLDMQVIWGSTDTNRNEGVDFSGAKFNGVDLKYRHLRFCNFEGAQFINTDMEGANLVGSNFKNADLTGANLKHANLAATIFSGANLRNTHWQYAHTASANLKGQDVSKFLSKPNVYDSQKVLSNKGGKNPDNIESIITGSNKNFTGENFSGKSFQGVRITKIDFTGANFDNANFDYAEIGDSNFALCSMKGATFRFARLHQNNFNEANLADADFYGATFSDSSFKKAILTNADFRYVGRAEMSMSGNVEFDGADLTGATFDNARLAWSDRQLSQNPTIKTMGSLKFKKANLTKASLTEAWMEGSDFSGANLTDASFSNGNFADSRSNFDTIWGGADFRNADMSRGSLSHNDVVNNTDGKTDFYTLRLKGSNWRGFKWILGAHLGPVDFSGCFFAQAPYDDPAKDEKYYGGTDFFNLAMPGAKFNSADLRYCGFGNADLRGASFKDADCSETEWSIGNSLQSGFEANLAPHEQRYNNINFDGTKFHGVNFASGDFKGSDFSSAKFDSESSLNPIVTFNGPTGLKK